MSNTPTGLGVWMRMHPHLVHFAAVTPTRQPPRRSAALAAFLSFVIPGLGQIWVGAVARGVLLIVPIVILVVGLAGFVTGLGSARFLGVALQPGVLLTILALDTLVLIYRLVAIVDAYRLGVPAGTNRDVARASRDLHRRPGAPAGGHARDARLGRPGDL